MESDYLHWLTAELERRGGASPTALGRRIRVGIGDDAAVVQCPESLVCCADLLAEGTHFVLRDPADLVAVGYKALAVNLSDMAAMGARPETALLSLLVNRADGRRQAESITRGLLDLADRFGVALIGGDTCSWDGGVVVNVTLNGSLLGAGSLLGSGPLLRSGAKPGDSILVTGELGGSILGHHWRFEPRCYAIEQLLSRARVHGATDISDGLICDLQHLLTASGVGAVLDADVIPIAAAARQSDERLEAAAKRFPAWPQWAAAPRPLLHALFDGEDFELLLTMSRDQADEVLDSIDCGELDLGCSLTRIGQVTESRELLLRSPIGLIPIPGGGYQH